ncbi:hypothetical protein D1BOALGB6SA_6643 [Olavius sp. associated proteobacterium Delta 1]|nr:hypothetical protein D1BOALGB6SA_6643 [Olavius sp. associated proteobacterium Delta 1]
MIMRISEKISFNEYWHDPKYATKKPVMNGSLKKMYGDNIYHHNGTKWIQVDSHHSLEDGSPNVHNLRKDTSVDAVLISNEYYYFGKKTLEISDEFIHYIVKKGPGHRCPDKHWGDKLISYISYKYPTMGYYDDPALFSKFERYDGQS